MKKAFSLVGVAIVAMAADATAELPAPGSTAQIQVQPVQAQLIAQVPLACSGAGASDVASKKHSIKNTTGHPIPKGTSIHWTSSDKGSGTVTLTTPLAPNDTVDVYQPGQTNGYTCTASFNPGDADFVVKSVAWTNATTATIQIENANPWTDAKASVALVRSLKCVQVPVGSVQVQVPAIAKGGSVTVTAQLPKSAADYLEATANATSSVPEVNKANNTARSVEFQQIKTCSLG